MSSSAYVEDAAEFAKALTWAEANSPGDYKNAMERAARKAGVSPGLLWRLRYRRPKIIDVADFEALGAAYEQRQLYRRERAEYAPKTALGRLLVRAIDAAIDEIPGVVSK